MAAIKASNNPDCFTFDAVVTAEHRIPLPPEIPVGPVQVVVTLKPQHRGEAFKQLVREQLLQPAGIKTKEEIDAYIRTERDSWAQ